MKRSIIAILVTAAALVCQSRADTWSFDYSGAGVTASGTITTGAALTTFQGFSGYYITGVSGQRNGVAITGLVPATTSPTLGYSTSPDGHWWFDNVLLSSGGFDLYGLLFTTKTGGEYNLYKSDGVNIDGFFDTRSGSFTLTPVKLNVPDGGTTLVLLGGALAGLALLRRRVS